MTSYIHRYKDKPPPLDVSSFSSFEELRGFYFSSVRHTEYCNDYLDWVYANFNNLNSMYPLPVFANVLEFYFFVVKNNLTKKSIDDIITLYKLCKENN